MTSGFGFAPLPEDMRASGPSEFEIIRRFFAPLCGTAPWLHAGVGEDCALVQPAAGESIAMSTDTLLPGVHFPADAEPAAVAQRALRVNLSDLAACGAAPLGVCLALSLPAPDEDYLAGFTAGLEAGLREFGLVLAGGDLVRGELSLTPQVFGTVPAAAALRRGGARAGDGIYVSGWLGEAAAGLALLEGRLESGDSAARESLLARYWRPSPRLALGQALRGVASAAIDVSDGLLADLGHMAEAGEVTMKVETGLLPLSPALAATGTPLQFVFGGDDYELCFTAPPQRAAAVQSAAEASGVPCALIGEVCKGPPRVVCPGIRDVPGWRHF